MELLNYLIRNDSFKILLLLIALDVIFGFLRAIKEKIINSTIGLDGGIRKMGMIITILFFGVIDSITCLDLLGFIPDKITTIIGLKDVGLSQLFIIIFIVYEFLSIIKNMIICKLPIPKKLQSLLENIMKEFTGELEETKVKSNIKK